MADPKPSLTPEQLLERERELAEAFAQFNELSDQLSASYAELEQQVEVLNQQLQQQAEEREQELAEKERIAMRLENLLQLLPGGVIVLDNQGRVSECNAAAVELLGEPLQGEIWSEIIQRSFAPRVDDGHEVSLKSGRRVSLATRSLEGEPGQIILLTDQTETRELQARLGHFQRLSFMGKMMASLAHQIRTPLSAAMLYSAHLTKPELRDEQRIKFANKVRGRLSSLEQQVRDMLVFARGETKLTDLISTEQLFSAIEDALDVPLTHADADADCINEAPTLLLQCNREALVGALMNLVNNALQAGARELVVRSQPIDQQYLWLQVQDDGPGMDAQQLAQSLEPFYSTKSQGTGLGLAVAQVVARAHHGDFVIDSVAGQGTIAGFKLPYKNPAALQTNAANAATTPNVTDQESNNE
ncbi:sensor histidine kinase [Motiliproteus sp.]|uniref:sensor histidine kinase n=1 Tax=Motiliproteus sp. TaxID=1898955 RepID=UPI003BADA5CF